MVNMHIDVFVTYFKYDICTGYYYIFSLLQIITGFDILRGSKNYLRGFYKRTSTIPTVQM